MVDAERAAREIAADAEALAAYDVGLLDVPEPVDKALRRLLSRRRDTRGWIDAGSVSLIGGDDR